MKMKKKKKSTESIQRRGRDDPTQMQRNNFSFFDCSFSSAVNWSKANENNQCVTWNSYFFISARHSLSCRWGDKETVTATQEMKDFPRRRRKRVFFFSFVFFLFQLIRCNIFDVLNVWPFLDNTLRNFCFSLYKVKCQIENGENIARTQYEKTKEIMARCTTGHRVKIM